MTNVNYRINNPNDQVITGLASGIKKLSAKDQNTAFIDLRSKYQELKRDISAKLNEEQDKKPSDPEKIKDLKHLERTLELSCNYAKLNSWFGTINGKEKDGTSYRDLLIQHYAHFSSTYFIIKEELYKLTVEPSNHFSFETTAPTTQV